jgi:N6-adenosine-specific RNA methylase IME4
MAGQRARPCRDPAQDFIANVKGRFSTILADPPWRFSNRTGKMAPEHRRLSRYETLTLDEIKEVPVSLVASEKSHLYLWVPNALLAEGMEVLRAWGFTYKTNIVWHKVRKDGGPDGRGVGFYFRNTTEIVLFGIRGHLRTLAPGRSQVNIIRTEKREHSRKPDELYDVIEACSPGPYLELFARVERKGWSQWGNQVEEYEPTWATYANRQSAINDKLPEAGPYLAPVEHHPRRDDARCLSRKRLVYDPDDERKGLPEAGARRGW